MTEKIETYDPELCSKLIAQAIIDDAVMPTGPWEVWTSNSFRRITGPDRVDGGVLSGVVQRDGQPDLSASRRTLEALCSVRNNILPMTRQMALVLADRSRVIDQRDRLRELLERALIELNDTGGEYAMGRATEIEDALQKVMSDG